MLVVGKANPKDTFSAEPAFLSPRISSPSGIVMLRTVRRKGRNKKKRKKARAGDPPMT